MGTYLSTPVTEKCQESGESLNCPETPVRWGVVDMQGWRKSMEDAHIAVTDVDVPAHHITTTPDGGEQPNIEDKPPIDAKVFGVFDGHGGPEVARFSALYLVSVLQQQETWQYESKSQNQKGASDTDMGKALISAFHALDRMIDDPEKREELIQLRSLKPKPAEQRIATSIPPPRYYGNKNSTTTDNTESNELVTTTKETKDTDSAKSTDSESTDDSTNENSPAAVSDDENDGATADKKESPVEDTTKNNDDDEDADSNEATGQIEALSDQNLDLDDENDGEETPESESAEADEQKSAAGKVTVMFQRLLNMSGNSGQVVLQVGSNGFVSSDAANTTPPGTLTANTAPANAVAMGGQSASQPSIVRNGQMLCNLPDHPIHAGATAIVAVITGRTLTVANAGDSRAVLCRGGGITYPLSFDHKPMQERELNRIRNAGGFVNSFGRVNGNLNLSRSIGDLKYKQVPNIPPPEQIITAQPDIQQVELKPDDEFLILGCDGIWDCLTNEKAVEFVRDRIDTKTPTEIGVDMLNTIISDDPRMTQGIGGDNMTIMIVDLQPLKRKYENKAETTTTD